MLIAVMMMIAVPVPTMNAATVNNQATTATAASELAGVRYLWLTRLSQPEPGIPSSRLKAKSIRPAAATDDRPQNHMAIAIPAARRSPSCPRLYSRMAITATPPPK